MDWGNLLNLLFFGFAMNGVSRIYEGKVSEKKSEAVKGIIQFCISIFGIAFASPIFTNVWFSLIAAVAFSLLSIGYMASVFVNAKPSEQIWRVDAQLLPPGEDHSIKESKKSTIPIAWNNVKSVVKYVKDK